MKTKHYNQNLINIKLKQCLFHFFFSSSSFTLLIIQKATKTTLDYSKIVNVIYCDTQCKTYYWFYFTEMAKYKLHMRAADLVLSTQLWQDCAKGSRWKQ